MTSSRKYQRSRLLGRGPRCDVYEGSDVGGLNRKVSIKQLRDEFQRDTAQRERFFSSAAKWSQSRHDHLVTVHDLDRTDGSVIYEPLTRSAKEVLDRQPTSPGEAVQILRDAAEGLMQLHRDGVLHLNVKPTNLLWDSRDQVKLADGHCRGIDARDELPAPVGSQKYLAPEMLDPAFGQICPATDIYCLGFVFAELLVGPRFDDLFRGVGVEAVDSERGWMRWHSAAGEKLPSLEKYVPHLPSYISVVLERMLHKDQLQRYRQLQELIDDLESGKSPSQATSNEQPSMVPQPVVSPIGRGAPPAPPSPPAAPAPPALRPVPSKPKVDPNVTDIPPRPDAPIVIRLVSGPKCGEMVGMNRDSFCVGTTSSCDVVFADSQATPTDLMVRLSRGANGWSVEADGSVTYLVNQEVRSGSSPIRSGDIVRLRAMGPDFQFLIHSQDVASLADLAGKFAPLMLQGAAQEAIRAASPVAAPHAPAPPSPAAPLPPGPKASPPHLPEPPSKKAAPQAPAAAPPPPPGPAPKPTKSKAEKTPKSSSPLFGLGSLDRKTRNKVLTAIGVVLMAAVIFLWPTGDKAEKAEVAPEGQAGNAEQAPQGESNESDVPAANNSSPPD